MVCDLKFLVGRLEFLIEALQLLDVTPQIRPGCRQLIFELSHYHLVNGGIFDRDRALLFGHESLLVENPQQSATMIRGVLAGRPGPPRDIVVANAAAALWTANRSKTLADGVRAAGEAIDTGAAADLLARLVTWTNR